MNYEQELTEAVEAVKREGRYRIFADVKRRRGAFPKADVLKGNAANTITVWCSNDYLGMGQHPKVLAAMHEAIDLVGAGSGGTRNIAGTTHYHVELEQRACQPPRQGGGAALYLGIRCQRSCPLDAGAAASRLRHLFGREESRIDDRRYPQWARAEANLPA